MDDLRAAIQESWSQALLAAGPVEGQAQHLVGGAGQRSETAPERAGKMAGLGQLERKPGGRE